MTKQNQRIRKGETGRRLWENLYLRTAAETPSKEQGKQAGDYRKHIDLKLKREKKHWRAGYLIFYSVC